MKRNIRTPFFVVNPKVYLYGEGSLALALEADKLAAEYDVDIFFTAQACDLSMIAKATKHLIITAQHMDGILPGKGMGSVLPEAIKNAGAEATFLNHAEYSLSISQLVNAVRRAKELDIIVLVCADSPEEARAIAELHPDIMICEPTSLIGSGNASDSEYKRRTNDSVRAVSPNTLVVCRTDPLYTVRPVNFLKTHQNGGDKRIQVNHQEKDQKRCNENIGDNLRIRQKTAFCKRPPGFVGFVHIVSSRLQE